MMSSNFQLSKQADPNKIFLTRFSAVAGGRFDPHFYKPDIVLIDNVVKNVSNRSNLINLGNLNSVDLMNLGASPKGVSDKTKILSIY